jgi:AcrR family transcriptional regulator
MPDTKDKLLQFSPVQVKILEAYVDLAYELGPAMVTLEKVAKKAGVAFSTVRYHFAGEQLDLMRSAVFYVGAIGQNYIQAFVESREREANFNGVHEYTRGTFQWTLESPAYVSYLFHFYYLCSTRVNLVLDNKAFLETARGRVRSLLFESIGRGLYRPVRDPVTLAQQIHILVIGGVLTALTERDKKALNRQLKVVLDAIDSLIHAEAKAK